jgi:hypothetical protein
MSRPSASIDSYQFGVAILFRAPSWVDVTIGAASRFYETQPNRAVETLKSWLTRLRRVS